VIAAGKSYDARGPQPNPGEPYEDVYSQMYDVPAVEFAETSPDVTRTPNMQGFIRNYAAQKDAPADAASIMNSLTPKTVPVLSSLAHHYAVCDRWFASIPTQTFCNRSFVHAGTSSGYVNNGGGGVVFVNDTPTIYDLLTDAGKSWKIYTGGWLLESFTLLNQKPLWRYGPTQHFSHFKNFLRAAAQPNGLPNYSFIEPIYFDSLVWGPHNDMHPECNPWEFYGASNLHRGEALLATIYEAVRNSPDWDSTLLVVLFDEHGGCYDHVAPPGAADCQVAVAPDRVIPKGEPGGIGFRFDRLGPRVPAVVISAYTPPQTRLHEIFEHTSVLSTVVNCFGLPQGRLGNRQAVAADLSEAVSLPEARTDRAPIAKPQFSMLADIEAEWHAIVHSRLLREKQKRPISDLQRMALHGAAMVTGGTELHPRIAGMQHELEADMLLMEREALFVKDRVSGAGS
jgi:phospholipase C